jgi:sulfide:quinone oxidoreductase
MRILVWAPGCGLELTTTLSETLGDQVEMTLIDKGEGFVFGFEADVMPGRTVAERVLHPYAGVVKPGVRLCRAPSVPSIPTPNRSNACRSVHGRCWSSPGRSPPEATPGLVEGGNEFYTLSGAFDSGCRQLQGRSGHRGRHVHTIQMPAAPSETALMMHDFLTDHGLRDQSEIGS